MSNQHNESAEKGLSSREQEILSLLAAGEGNQEIAARLALSVKTVESYLSSIYTKLGVKSRIQAMLWLKSAERRNSRQ